MEFQTEPDIPFDDRRGVRDDYRHNNKCPHPQRVFAKDDTQPDGRSKTEYRCVICGKHRAMKVWKI